MTSYLRKNIVMKPYNANDAASNFGYWYTDWTATATPYVRFWVSWKHLAYYGANNPATDTRYAPGGGTIQQYVQALDAQIGLAKSQGLKVILTFWLFPSWANGGQNHFVAPSDVSPSSNWAVYLWWVLSRWSVYNPNNGGAWADFLEVCNEPNVQFQPQKDAVGNIVCHLPTAEMMITAQSIQRSTGITSPILVGPGMGDRRGGASTYSDSLDFVNLLMDRLNSRGFHADQYFAFSSHNYADIETNSNTRSQDIRGVLQSKGWTGWPYANSSDPYILLTEGGSKLTGTSQADQVRLRYDSIHNDNAGAGKGLAMFSQYLDASDVNYDTGLRNPASPYATRAVYNTWAARPSP